jgi:hypothetical protein|tara:strand:+ start:121 stop:387 length:267 start_codon:yes stop_codon:yes gene_type:complete
MTTPTIQGKSQAEKVRLMLLAAPMMSLQDWNLALNPPSPAASEALLLAAAEREKEEAAKAAREKLILYGGVGVASLIVLGGVVALLRR